VQRDGVITFSSHKGYVSLMPLMFGIIKDESVLNRTLQLVADEEELWTPYGLRSLSKRDEYFG